jgi:polyphosphate kinase 2
METVNNKVVKKVKKENNLKPKAETNKTTAKKPSTKKQVINKIEIKKTKVLAQPNLKEAKPKPEWEQQTVSLGELKNLKTKNDLSALFGEKNGKPQKILSTIRYEEELEKLQIELVKMQRWVQDNGKRIAILFEGRDAAGKGGTIRRFTEHMNPRALRVVALPKPTEEERGQWYFQRYIRQLPNKGEIVFFDRSWYNRAVVEPVNNFCSNQQYEMFMKQVNDFEHMLYEDGIIIVKFWFSIAKDEQLNRFESRKRNPLKQWKLSPVDMLAQDRWDIYTKFKEEMFNRTHSSFSPWIIVKANNKQKARLESIRYVLSQTQYEGKGDNDFRLFPDPNIITRFHRKALQVDN